MKEPFDEMWIAFTIALLLLVVFGNLKAIQHEYAAYARQEISENP